MSVVQAQLLPSIPQYYEAVSQDLMIYALQGLGDLQIHHIYRFSGRVDERVMARAVRLVMEVEPILGCRFVTGAGSPYWQRRKDLDRLELCKVVETTQPEADLRTFAAEPQDTRRDPQVLARIFRSSTDTLHVKVNHVVADATGAREITYLIAALYRRLMENPNFLPKPNLYGSRSQQQILKYLGPDKLLRSMLAGGPPAQNWGCPSNGSYDTSPGVFALRRFDPNRMAAIKAYGKQHQATLNDMLLAAFFRAMVASTNHPPGKPLNIMVPFNLRRFIPSGRTGAICNMAGAVFPAFAPKPGESFDGTLLRVQRTMDRLKIENPGIGTMAITTPLVKTSLPLLERSVKEMRVRSLKTGKSIGIMSNFGIINPARLNFGEIEVEDAYALGPVAFPPGLMLSVISFRETLTVSCGFCEDATPREFIEGLLDRMDQELPKPLPTLMAGM